jgi:hypothetical protein
VNQLVGEVRAVVGVGAEQAGSADAAGNHAGEDRPLRRIYRQQPTIALEYPQIARIVNHGAGNGVHMDIDDGH